MSHLHRSAVERDLIVIGGSAGALPVLRTLIGGLAQNLPAAVMVVMHQDQSQPGRLPEILGSYGPLPAEHAIDGAPIELGRIYVAPPDAHLLVERGRLRLSRGPKENRFRPAIDPLFRTAARSYGPQVIGVILSGLLDDGTLGLMRIKHFGGVAIVQDPADADSPDMPASESASLHRRMELKAMEGGQSDMGRRYGERAEEQERRTETVRRLLLCEEDHGGTGTGAVHAGDA